MEYIPRNCDSFKIDFYALEHSLPLPLSLSVRFIQLKEGRTRAREPMIRATLLHALLYLLHIGGRDFQPTQEALARFRTAVIVMFCPPIHVGI